MLTAREIIEALGGCDPVADSLTLPYTTVHSWMRHDSIPAWRWSDVLDLAARKGVAIASDERPIRSRRAA